MELKARVLEITHQLPPPQASQDEDVGFASCCASDCTHPRLPNAAAFLLSWAILE